MIELSMHILDIVENAVTAGANKVSIIVEENRKKDILTIEIRDNGRGMDQIIKMKALDPFVTMKEGKSIGLGLAMFSEAAKRSGGKLNVDSKPGGGTFVRATFGLNHVDRQPLGDMIETIVTLVVGHPDVDFTYCQIQDGKEFLWSTEKIWEQFGDVPRSSSEVVNFIRKEMRKGLVNFEM